MTEEEYIKERLEDQIKWYDDKSQRCQKYFKRLRGTVIVLGALIPTLGAFSAPVYMMSIAGSLIVIIEGFLSFNKYHEQWIEYRSICETLKHEKFMFYTQTGVYHQKNENLFKLLVERVESIISKETVNWANMQTKIRQEEKKSNE